MDPRDSDTTQRTLLSPGPDQPEAQAACIVVIHGEGLGKRVDIRDARIAVGRDHACDLHILHPSVSRRHCEIWAEDGRYRVRSAGGQFLGLAKIAGGVLKVEKLFVERNEKD